MNESPSNDNESTDLPEKIEINLEVKKSDDVVTEKNERKKNDKVISGEAIRRKKPLGARFKNVFFGGDAKSVAENVINDVLLPAAKEMISDAFSRTVDGMLFGDRDARSGDRRRRGGSVGSNITSAIAGHIQYNRMSQQSRRDDYPRSRSRFRSALDDFEDILVPSRRDADDVLMEMENIIRKYQFASRADLLELVGREDDIEYTDRKWGWSDLRDAASRRVAGGAYLLELPPQERRDRV